MRTALRLVTEDDDVATSDDEVTRLERVIAQNAQNEQILWGGPMGEGIVPSIRRLSETVAQLAATVTTLATRVTGEDGHGMQLRQIREKMEYQEKQRTEETRLQEIKSDRRFRLTCVAITFCVSALGWLLTRSAYVTMHGVTVAHP